MTCSLDSNSKDLNRWHVLWMLFEIIDGSNTKDLRDSNTNRKIHEEEHS